jgi:hypothetical protein
VTRRVAAVTAGLMVLMGAFGFGVYSLLGHFKSINSSAATKPPDNPKDATPRLTLPGTIYLSQGGDLFALHGTAFTVVLTHSARGSWVQPALLQDGNLLVVSKNDVSSDLYEVRPDGSVVGRLISGAGSKLPDGSLVLNYWVFDPRPSVDGAKVFFAYDSAGKGDFVHDFAIWGMPLTAPPAPTPTPSHGLVRPQLPSSAQAWTTPNTGTGGDIDPIPLPSGRLLYTKYSLDAKAKVHSQLWVVASPRDNGYALTTADQDCSQPSLSPDGTQLAMICTNGDQLSRVVVAPLVTTPATATPGQRATPSPSLGPQRVLVDGTLAAQPVWSPTGDGLIYLAPAETGANFQLWWLAGAGSANPQAPAQVTSSLGFDATSRPAWSAS